MTAHVRADDGKLIQAIGPVDCKAYVFLAISDDESLITGVGEMARRMEALPC